MDEVSSLLKKHGWKPTGFLESNYDKPVFAKGKWKCCIGKVWVTIWRLVKDGTIDDMESYKTDDLALIEKVLH